MRPVRLVLLLILGAFAAVPYLNSRLNNARLRDFASQLFDYPLPEDARVISERATVGVLLGMGNHCDFVAELEIESSVSLAELQSHYAELVLTPAAGGGTSGGLPIVRVSPVGKSVGVYQVVAMDGPYSAGLDFRCR